MKDFNAGIDRAPPIERFKFESTQKQTIFRSSNSLTIIELSPEKLRGRVLSITLLDNALSPVFGLLVGVIADNWGVNVGYYMLSLGCFVIILIVLLIYPRIKNIS